MNKKALYSYYNTLSNSDIEVGDIIEDKCKRFFSVESFTDKGILLKRVDKNFNYLKGFEIKVLYSYYESRDFFVYLNRKNREIATHKQIKGQDKEAFLLHLLDLMQFEFGSIYELSRGGLFAVLEIKGRQVILVQLPQESYDSIYVDFPDCKVFKIDIAWFLKQVKRQKRTVLDKEELNLAYLKYRMTR